MASYKGRLDNLFRKALSRGVCSQSFTIDDLISAADKKLFRWITSNYNHCLHSLFPPPQKKDTQKHWILSEVEDIYINCLKLNLTYLKLPKNPNFWGVNRDFPAKRAKYCNVHIIKTTASIITKFCRVIEIPKYSLWVVQICPKQIQDGGRPPSWKIEKSQYCNS